MAVTKRTRFEVLRRDNHTCRYCGATAPEATLTVDHVTPVALGGTDDPSNLVAACRDCNAGKSSTAPDASLVEDVAQDALRWARAIKLAAERRSEAEEPMRQYVAEFDQKWRTWHFGSSKELIPRSGNWRNSIERFYELGVPLEELTRLVDVACGNERIKTDETWRYFCGCVWRYVKDIQESASEILAADESPTAEPEGIPDREWAFRLYTRGWWDGYFGCETGWLISDPLSAVVDRIPNAHLATMNEVGMIYSLNSEPGDLFETRLEETEAWLATTHGSK